MLLVSLWMQLSCTPLQYLWMGGPINLSHSSLLYSTSWQIWVHGIPVYHGKRFFLEQIVQHFTARESSPSKAACSKSAEGARVVR